MAADKFLNLTGLTYFYNKLKTVFALKSDHDALEDRVDDLEVTGGQPNKIETVKVNNVALTITDKAVNVTVPTKLTDLTNDGNFVTDASYVHTDNNYTTTEKSKLSGIASGAQVNKIESVKVNGTALTISSKAVNVVVPTKLTDLTNDGNFVTDAGYVHTDVNFTQTLKDKLDGIAAGATKITVDAALSSSSTNPLQNKAINTALGNKAPLASPTLTGTPKAPTAAAGTNTTQIATTEFVTTAVANAIGGVTQISYSKVNNLPQSGAAGTIYLVSHSHGTNDVYDEYIWTGTGFEKLGNTDIDLTDYMQYSDMVAITTSEVDSLFT